MVTLIIRPAAQRQRDQSFSKPAREMNAEADGAASMLNHLNGCLSASLEG